MKISMIKTIVAASVLAVCVAGPVSAGKPGPVAEVNCDYFGNSLNACTSYLSGLCGAIDGADSLDKRDRDTMVSKTIGADIKLEQDKIDEADNKLYKIELKLDSLLNASKPKINGDDFSAISGALTTAQRCVDGL